MSKPSVEMAACLHEINQKIIELENKLSMELTDKMFGDKEHGLIGCVNEVDVVLSSSYFGGLEFKINIRYQPAYMFGIAKDAEEVLHLSIKGLDNLVFADDQDALLLMLECMD